MVAPELKQEGASKLSSPTGTVNLRDLLVVVLSPLRLWTKLSSGVMAVMASYKLRGTASLLPAIIIASLAAVSLGRSQPAASLDQQRDKQPLKLPAGWNPRDPLPAEKTNCVRCHLTAGRELTAPVRDFARSVHDRSHLSCNDCHGGNTQEDSTAHENEHGFIGTKLSAHMEACSMCHALEARWFQKGKHYWDLSKRINRDYPVCIDCHGSHDIARPPEAFSTTNVCTDCHKQFAKDMPAAAGVIAENDRLWLTLRKVHAKNSKDDEPTPAAFRKELKTIRGSTSRLIHGAQRVTADEADTLNRRVRALREKLETWLKEHK